MFFQVSLVTRDLTGDVPDWVLTWEYLGNFGPNGSTHPGPLGQIGGYSDVRWHLKRQSFSRIFLEAPKRWSHVDSRGKGQRNRMKGSFVAFGGLRGEFVRRVLRTNLFGWVQDPNARIHEHPIHTFVLSAYRNKATREKLFFQVSLSRAT